MTVSNRCRIVRAFVGVAAAVAAAGQVQADTVSGGSMAFKSDGSATLSQSGYFGTYIKLGQAGAVTLTANASGTASNGVDADMTLSVADSSQSFDVSPAGPGNYTFTTPTLAAGTYFVRTQLDNHKTLLVNGAAIAASTGLTLNSLSVSSNATINNTSTDAIALTAANTYIDNYRKGNATVKLIGATAGSTVHVRLTSNAFNIGSYVPGTTSSSSDNYLAASPAVGTNAYYFQHFVNGRYNTLVPSNAGKWTYNEYINSSGVSSGPTGMGPVDRMTAYAAAHSMTARQHNLIWGSQQPTQVVTWLNTITTTTNTQAARTAAYNSLESAITNRVNYYIKAANTVDGKARATDFQQLDVLNEALQTGNYFNALGYNPSTNTITAAQSYAGVANIYKQVQTAVSAAGANTRLYTNEYNVYQNSPTTITASNTYSGNATATYGDGYANWYRNEVESINNAGLAAGATGNVVTGIGTQYYPTATGTKGPATIQEAVQNLAVEGLPISMNEFGGQTSITAAQAPQLVDGTIRMMMGTASVNTFMQWGWYDDGTASTNMFGGGTVLVNKGWVNADGTWNLTAAGKRFEYLFGRALDPTAPGANPDGSNPDPWMTNEDLAVNADGTITFNGFYGTYLVTVNGVDYDLTYAKGGDATLTLAVPEPATLGLIGLASAAATRRPERRSKRRCAAQESLRNAT